jgi:hypothetical protein
VPFAAVIAAWHRRYPGGPPAPEAERLHQRFADLVAQNQTEHVSRLTAQDLLPLCAACAEALLSPDIMLAAPDLQALDRGAYQLVIGEIHHGVQPVGWMLGFADDREGWERDVAELLPRPTASCIPANLIFKRRMKTAPPEFDGPSVQVSGIAQHSDAVDLSQLVVERHGAEVRLRRAGEARSVRFYPPCYGVPSGAYGPFACFSYPLVQQVKVRLGAHTPRIEIDGVVYQRERWDLPTSELPGRDLQGTSFRLLVEYAEFQHRLGLPDHLFVQTPAEPKPVYIDMRNYFALELLAHLAGQSETISLVEMCPGPEQLWLEDADGHYCCEFRTVLSAA